MQKRAFTLIELIFGLVIMGVLGGITAGKISDMRTEAQVATLNTELGSFVSELRTNATVNDGELRDIHGQLAKKLTDISNMKFISSETRGSAGATSSSSSTSSASTSHPSAPSSSPGKKPDEWVKENMNKFIHGSGYTEGADGILKLNGKIIDEPTNIKYGENYTLDDYRNDLAYYGRDTKSVFAKGYSQTGQNNRDLYSENMNNFSDFNIILDASQNASRIAPWRVIGAERALQQNVFAGCDAEHPDACQTGCKQFFLITGQTRDAFHSHSTGSGGITATNADYLEGSTVCQNSGPALMNELARATEIAKELEYYEPELRSSIIARYAQECALKVQKSHSDGADSDKGTVTGIGGGLSRQVGELEMVCMTALNSAIKTQMSENFSKNPNHYLPTHTAAPAPAAPSSSSTSKKVPQYQVNTAGMRGKKCLEFSMIADEGIINVQPSADLSDKLCKAWFKSKAFKEVLGDEFSAALLAGKKNIGVCAFAEEGAFSYYTDASANSIACVSEEIKIALNGGDVTPSAPPVAPSAPVASGPNLFESARECTGESFCAKLREKQEENALKRQFKLAIDSNNFGGKDNAEYIKELGGNDGLGNALKNTTVGGEDIKFASDVLDSNTEEDRQIIMKQTNMISSFLSELKKDKHADKSLEEFQLIVQGMDLCANEELKKLYLAACSSAYDGAECQIKCADTAAVRKVESIKTRFSPDRWTVSEGEKQISITEKLNNQFIALDNVPIDGLEGGVFDWFVPEDAANALEQQKLANRLQVGIRDNVIENIDGLPDFEQNKAAYKDMAVNILNAVAQNSEAIDRLAPAEDLMITPSAVLLANELLKVCDLSDFEGDEDTDASRYQAVTDIAGYTSIDALDACIDDETICLDDQEGIGLTQSQALKLKDILTAGQNSGELKYDDDSGMWVRKGAAQELANQISNGANELTLKAAVYVAGSYESALADSADGEISDEASQAAAKSIVELVSKMNEALNDKDLTTALNNMPTPTQRVQNIAQTIAGLGPDYGLAELKAAGLIAGEYDIYGSDVADLIIYYCSAIRAHLNTQEESSVVSKAINDIVKLQEDLKRQIEKFADKVKEE